ncbi:dnaJ homolog subfamily C member 8-like [Oppia nitens]|uniref:dnaJ homolog subfamily C member 8-like n=1 Tax=Oppia nitens TaxID=1686743 RepID=UPI0023DC5593|nr:dnaJ homolog subfamily C member 8-like [Oppia nitens]
MTEKDFQKFYHEVKHVEKEDSVYTSAKQLARLLRPGSTYANLNPFEVLLVDPEDGVDVIKRQYKKLSILLHPDKNPDDRDRAQTAFDVLNKAYKCLEAEQTRARALEVVEEAKFKVNQMIDEKRKKLKKERGLTRDRDAVVDEDDPLKFKQAVKVQTIKLFADYERKRRSLEDRAQEERKRKREQEIDEEETKQVEKEWTKNFEESRQTRVNSWQSFSKNSKSKRKDIRPPKHKAETR